MKNKLTLLIFLLVVGHFLKAQQAFPVTDTQPVTINGLTIGYNIKSTEVKTVSGRGDFSRYAISFYVYNIDNTPKIIRIGDGYNQPGNVSAVLAQFNILNATGYRLTSNSATISAAPYNVDIPGRGLKLVGYWIQGGQSINVDEIVICPLNQLPNVQAIFVANSTLQPFEPREFEHPREQPPVVYQNAPPVVYQTAPPANMSGFYRIRNYAIQSFINNQNGYIASTPIDPGWWSAQWEFLPVPGTPYFYIRNRWKSNYLHQQPGERVDLVDNTSSPFCVWILEPSREPGKYRIKNAQSNFYITFAHEQVYLSNDREHQTQCWLEKP